MGNPQSKIAVAIDFGTKFTGFAYLFHTYSDHIYTASHGSYLPTDRVPTVLLLNPDGSFNSFGINAEDNYAKLMTRGEHHSYKLFREFKMALYTQNEKLNVDIHIFDTDGRQMRAMTVFSEILKYLKQLILKSIKSCGLTNTYSFESSITWMLTIPAIWSDSARQFMRTAAVEAGFDEKSLRLVLEPEAAALFCKYNLSTASSFLGWIRLKSNPKYILADLGGGTADFCVHEVLPNKTIRELYQASGGAYGGSNVNNEFIHFIMKVFGATVVKTFKRTRLFDYLLLEREFERNKCAFDMNTDDFIINIPSALLQMFDNNSNDSDFNLQSTLKSNYASLVDLREDTKLVCKRHLMELFFKSSIDGIIKSLQEILDSCSSYKLDALLVVGGFAESKYIREVIQEKIHEKYNINIVLPQEPNLAVLKGALKMELIPNIITERRSRYTYGFCVAEPFREGEDPSNLKFMRGGKHFCDRIFCKVFEKDMVLKVGQIFRVNVNEEIRESKNINLSIALYRTTKRDLRYCLESNDCVEVGKIILEAPRGGWPRRYDIDQILIAGETELKVKAFDKINFTNLETRVDFL